MPFSERRATTPNISPGRNRLLGVVFHHTAGSYEGAVAWLRDRKAKASAHVVIARDGRRTVLASDTAITWHAGAAYWARHGDRAVNSSTLGIEFELTAEQVEAGAQLRTAQIASAIEYLAPRIKAHGWTMDDFSHHAAVCRPAGRKRDLSSANWSLVQKALTAHYATLRP